jgi:hypothetical protein
MRALLDAKFFDIRIEHELFAGYQGNAQEIAVALELFPWNALDKRVALSRVDQTVVKSFPLRTNSVQWRARSLALSLDMSAAPFDLKKSRRQPKPSDACDVSGVCNL